jgi:pyruvate formate lyase activating enzyme
MYYELLNFNPLGDGKYRGLGRENRFASAKPLDNVRLEEFRSIAESRGVPVRVG